MNNKRRPMIHFDYGGYYISKGEESRWISRENVHYALLMKTSIDEVTYSELVSKICRKKMVDEATTEMRLSYVPVSLNPKKPIYIFDDDDLLCYLEMNQDVYHVLHVEVGENVEQNQGCDEVAREEQVVEVGASNDEIISSGRAEHNEVMDACEERVDVDNYDVFEGVEVTPVENVEWEDGMNLTLHQEFATKQAMQDYIEKAAIENCFEFSIVKSDTKLYLIRCCEYEKGCKWYLRTAKLKNSNCFSVRTYHKMHTCLHATTSTIRNKRRCTPQLVASVLREDYPSMVNTLKPKDLIDMVEGKLGVKVSYSTALRGKKLATSESFLNDGSQS